LSAAQIDKIAAPPAPSAPLTAEQINRIVPPPTVIKDPVCIIQTRIIGQSNTQAKGVHQRTMHTVLDQVPWQNSVQENFQGESTSVTTYDFLRLPEGSTSCPPSTIAGVVQQGETPIAPFSLSKICDVTNSSFKLGPGDIYGSKYQRLGFSRELEQLLSRCP
jgi:hypothetical protein